MSNAPRIFQKARLPAPRISAYPKAPGRLMGPGPSVGKPGPTPPENPFFFGPVSGLGYSSFSEIFRQSVRGYMHGKMIVGADVAISAATAGTFVAPFLYIDVQIIGYTNGVPEVLAYGAPGSIMLGTNGAYPGLNDNVNLSAPPAQTTWDDSFGFDEVAVLIRSMGNGGQPFGAGWATNPGDIINVNIAGKTWR
jgi:hypothetical protein